MEQINYQKYKDRKPEDTLFRIQTILHEMGLTTTHQWVDQEYEGCYSNRVNIYPTQLGTNGKGTDPIYALTSGYAELMERIQNNILYIGELSQEDQEYGGFLKFPDERLIPFDELLEEKNILLEHIFENLGCKEDFEKRVILREFANMKNGTETECLCIPFVDPESESIVFLPQELLFIIYGSNGMSAGNTMEEALVQGLAEILERYVNRKIALEHICPPSVPRNFIEKIPSLNKVICEIEEDGKYQVVVKDCSLGRGIPVVAIVIINQETGTFGVKFASHPSFSVALERTLTEAFQGKKLEQFTAANRIGSDEQIHHRDNLLNMMKIGNGVYPKELLVGTPDYPFVPDGWIGGKSNREMLRSMLTLIKKEGYQVLIHESSYLGFHSYFTIVPGMSEMYPIDRLRIREYQTYVRLEKSFSHLHSLTDEEAKRIVLYSSFKEQSMLENQLVWISGRPLSDRIPGKDAATVLLKACCLYQIGDFVNAAKEMEKVSNYYNQQETGEEKEFYRCCNTYLYFRAIGYGAEDCNQLIGKLFKEELAARVREILSDHHAVIRKMYPDTNCYDCEHCEMDRQGMCRYREVSGIIRKIKDALKKNIPDQSRFLEKLKRYVIEENGQ